MLITFEIACEHKETKRESQRSVSRANQCLGDKKMMMTMVLIRGLDEATELLTLLASRI